MEHTPKQLLGLSKSEKDPRKRMRLLAVSHFSEGRSRTDIANMLKVSRTSVNLWVASYLARGLEGLETQKAKGRASYLSHKQQQRLSRYIENQIQQKQGGRLTGESILTYIKQTFDVSYHPNAIYKLLKTLGFSWITSRSRHPKQSQQAQDEFKKTTD